MPNPHSICSCSLAATDIPPAHSAHAIDGGHDADREMDSDEERDFADQGPLTDMDMEESGGGATAGAAPGWCPSQMRRGSGASVSARAGPGRQRRVSVAGRQQRRGLPQAAAELERIEQTGL